MDPDDLLADLDPEQRQVACALAGPVCVLAGAGTGKTRAITHRIAYGVRAGAYVPQHVLAVTFTSRAAGEMRTRLRDLGVGGVQARTFHSAALRQLQFFWPQVVGGALPRVAEVKAPLVADAAARLRLAADRARVRDLSAEIEWAKVNMLDAESYPPAARRAGRADPAGVDHPTMARVLRTYEDVKTDRGVLDFEDVLLLTTAILQDSDEVASAVRSQYRHFVVDEYQDVSPLQERLLGLWLGERDEVCVVGDPNQTIYSFAGASPSYLLGFPARHRGAQVIRLVRNYRSTPQIIAVANGVLAPPGHGGGGRLELRAQRPPGRAAEFAEYEDDVAEAAAVAAAIARLVHAGTPAGEVAVLFRTNAQSPALEQALSDAGLPYLLRGGERFFARKEVRDALVLLRGAARTDAARVEASLTQPGDDLPALADRVGDVLTAVGWSAQPPQATGAVRERWGSLRALVGLAEDLEAAGGRAGSGDRTASIADVVRELDERAAAQHAPAVDGVTLASLHAAKGLEWGAVFLVGVSDGLLPISLADGPGAVEEERRLLYVGLTRARDRLQLSWSRARSPGARASRQPSRFLDGIRPGTRPAGGPARAPVAAPAGRRDRKPARCRGCGKVLVAGSERKVGRCAGCPPTYDESCFERLRSWRSQTAARDGVPAYVVFTDATLVAIAEGLPADRDALAAIPGVGPAKLERYAADVLAVLDRGMPDAGPSTPAGSEQKNALCVADGST